MQLLPQFSISSINIYTIKDFGTFPCLWIFCLLILLLNFIVYADGLIYYASLPFFRNFIKLYYLISYSEVLRFSHNCIYISQIIIQTHSISGAIGSFLSFFSFLSFLSFFDLWSFLFFLSLLSFFIFFSLFFLSDFFSFLSFSLFFSFYSLYYLSSLVSGFSDSLTSLYLDILLLNSYNNYIFS